ncbi:hypothetical protein PVAP13_2KG262790 [Panicum virgatum]|uniref:Uncharacterized protein n=1 Tax=Panicum virgatum TaxID=38727 RepID=A0A8T0W1I6_PANVG|nr:hypothetical protein PVAP13_2KG262790 [Panicum virgatum]
MGPPHSPSDGAALGHRVVHRAHRRGRRVVRSARRQGRALRHGCRLGMKPYSARAADERGPPSLAPPLDGALLRPHCRGGGGGSAHTASSGQNVAGGSPSLSTVAGGASAKNRATRAPQSRDPSCSGRQSGTVIPHGAQTTLGSAGVHEAEPRIKQSSSVQRMYLSSLIEGSKGTRYGWGLGASSSDLGLKLINWSCKGTTRISRRTGCKVFKVSKQVG